MNNNLLDVDLPNQDEIRQMNPTELKDLLKYLKTLNHALGNGTLKKVQDCKEVCRDMIRLVGELDADLKQ